MRRSSATHSECQLSDGIPSSCFHLIAPRQRPRCISAVHHTWPHFSPLTTTCSASKGTHTEGVIPANASVRTQVTWDAPAAAAEILILSDLPSFWPKHLSGKEFSFRSALILLECAEKWAAGGGNAACVGLYSRHGLISSHLPWEMGLINSRQYIYLPIKTDTHHWTHTVAAVILVTICVGGFLSSKEHRSHEPRMNKVTVQPFWRKDFKILKGLGVLTDASRAT